MNKKMFMIFCLFIFAIGFCREAVAEEISAEDFFEIHDLSAVSDDGIEAKIEKDVIFRGESVRLYGNASTEWVYIYANSSKVFEGVALQNCWIFGRQI